MGRKPTRGGTLTLAQIARAATIYRHASIACGDAGGAENVDQNDVMHEAMVQARMALDRLGIDPAEVGTLDACIAKARLPRWAR